MIQPTLPNQNRVYDAIRDWEQNTSIRFILRTDSNAKHYINYASFIQYTPQLDENQEEVFHCSSPIGMQGGEQHAVISDQINALPVMSFMRLDMQLDYGISKVEKTETSMRGFDWRIFQIEFSQMEHMIGRRI